MEKLYRFTRTSLPTAFVLSLVFFMFTGTLGASPQSSPADWLSESYVSGNPAMTEKLQAARFTEAFLERVRQRAEIARHDEVFMQKIREYPAGEKMSVFLKRIAEFEKQGMAPGAWHEKLNEKKVLFKGAAAGGISGTVKVAGGLDGVEQVEIVAFDIFGFPAGAAFADPGSGAYEIMGLPAGDYYVVTHSPFVNEFYDDVPLDLFESWRNATLVTVTDGVTTTNIDFDLARGAKVTGIFTNAETGAPISHRAASFFIFRAADPRPVYRTDTILGGGGDYEIIIPETGGFKVLVVVDGFAPEFYDDKTDFATADVITVTSLDQDIAGIDFALTPEGEPEGGKISGNVFGPGPAPIPFAFVFSFNVADTSISGLALSGFIGDYEITGLENGDHILYADDLLGFFLGLPGLQGEYYEDAATSAEATPITISSPDDEVTGIVFNLDPGGTIAGTVTDSDGAPVDTILVVAVSRFDLDQVTGFFPDQVQLGIGVTGADGSYEIAGLRSGTYVVRTVSLLNEKHAGRLVDEYYDNVPNIFDFKQATDVVVEVPGTTGGIDFELQIGGGIAGRFLELDGTTPVMGEGTVLVFNAQSGNPELAFTMFDTTNGSYGVGPLPTGVYVLLGFVSSDEVIYLPQFYDGAASPEEATPVSVTAPAFTAGIDFKMVRAGTVEGFVNLAPDFSAGADTIGALVVAYDANTGVVAGGSETTFSGGYRIRGLPPGEYKVIAYPGTDGYAGTYFGGGTTFDDPNSTVVTVQSDMTAAKTNLGVAAGTRADIELVTANGTISGMVTDLDGNPLNGVLVIAYDQTGHAVSAGASGFDLQTELPTGPGEYRIQGLPSGSYFVRTFALFRLLTVLNQLEGFAPDDEDGDPLGLLFALLGGAGDLLGEVELFADKWYQDVPVPVGDFDPLDLLLTLLSGGLEGDFPLILPFFDVVAEGAQLVSVTSPGETGGIDFALESLERLPTDVQQPDVASVPTSFELLQNYPNPFNPGTAIVFRVPQTSHVKVRVYNLLGQRIRTLFEGVKEAGSHTLRWDGLNERGEPAAAGVYFLRLETEKQTLARKMLLVR